MIETFIKFLKDKEAAECYITGIAGTGKTTSLAQLISYCHEHNIKAITCAYTHKAVGILISKLPEYAETCTIHSFLTKRPTINEQATKIDHVDSNKQMGTPDKVGVLFIDEFSMIGERDYVDIAALQYDEDGNIVTKVVYIGDPNQLPPVKDQIVIVPGGDYWIKLTQVHRQANDNPLIDTLVNLNSYISGKKAVPLESHSNFIRDQDIVELYKNDTKSKVLLAYTNAQVEYLNSLVEGKHSPSNGDYLFTPTLRKFYTLDHISPSADYILNIQHDVVLQDSKYKTLETLHEIEGILFYMLADEEGNLTQRPGVFGHDTYLQLQKKLANKAVMLNREIERKHNEDAKTWSHKNWSTDLAKKRQKAWKEYMSFKDCVICLDFAHAMTVHKSQGSTYENVYLDIQDIGKCADNDYSLYLKLLYVGISRASKTVYTN